MKSQPHSVRISDEAFREIERLATRDVRTLTGQIDYMVADFIKRHEALTPSALLERSNRNGS